MKKFVSGLIVGAVLMFSSQAFGASINFIGKKVDGQAEVKVDGEVVGQAVIIQGKSFAPVRDIVNSFGGTVDSTTGGVISLSSNTDDISVGQPTTEPTDTGKTTPDTTNSPQIDELTKKISTQQATVDRITNLVSELQKKVDDLKAKGIDPITQNIELNLMKEQLTKETTTLDNLESQLAELQK